jgi:hypothetical protein
MLAPPGGWGSLGDVVSCGNTGQLWLGAVCLTGWVRGREDGADGAVRRRVDAALLRRCCHELQDQMDPRGIRLRNALVTGGLDLAGLRIPFPLRFEGCEFDVAPTVEGVQLHELALTGCEHLPGLLANGVRVQRDLDLSRSHVRGGHKTSASTSRRPVVWLCESEIGGCLLCVDTVIDGDGGRSLHADRIRVSGSARFIRRFAAHGDMRLLGARIGGSLDLAGARIESMSSGRALSLNEATIGGRPVPRQLPDGSPPGRPGTHRHDQCPHFRAVAHQERHP